MWQQIKICCRENIFVGQKQFHIFLTKIFVNMWAHTGERGLGQQQKEWTDI